MLSELNTFVGDSACVQP